MKSSFALIGLPLSCILTLATYSQTAQTQEPTQAPAKKAGTSKGSDDVVRINTNLVQIDVTVTDDKGRPVSDLKPEDFEVLEEGRPQQITHFSYVAPSASVPSTAAPAALPLMTSKATGKEKTVLVPTPVPPIPLRPEQVRRTVALVVDDLGLSHESSARVRQALSKFVDEQIQPGDLVAVIRTGAGMGALQQFTTDRRLLHAAIERIHFNLGSRSEISTFAPIGGNGIAVQINDDSLALRYGGGPDQTKDERAAPSFLRSPGDRLDQFREELFSVGTLGALNFVVRGLKEMPGRKSVVLFSDGFKMYSEDPGNRRVLDNLQRLTDLANRASVVFYTIDPRGLQYFGITAADNLNGPLGTFNLGENPDPGSIAPQPQVQGTQRVPTKLTDEFYKHRDNIEQAITDRRSNFFESQHGLSYLASQTGGFLVKNNNDINGALRRVLNDQNGFYLLGYRPDEASFKGDNGRRRFHNITVKIKRQDLRVRTRKGFYGFTDEEASRPTRSTAAEQLFAALTSPFKSGDIKMRMTALFGYDQERGSFTQSLVHISAQDLTFKPMPNGWREAVIDIMAVTFGDNGKVVDQDDRSYRIQIADKELQRVQLAGLVYFVTLPVKKPGAYQLRIAVRDHATEKVGSANQFIEVPDVKKGRLSLSGITLRGLDADVSPKPGTEPSANVTAPVAEGTAGNSDLKDPRTGPAGRHLQAGMILSYAYVIYNAHLDKVTRLPRLSTQLRLFRDGRLIFTGRLNEYKGAPQKDSRQLIAGGSFRLGSDLPPGDYVLQVVVIDNLAKSGQQVASQWIDFDIGEQ